MSYMSKKGFPLLLLLATALFLSACEKLDELTTFRINHTTSITIKANNVIANVPIIVPSPEIETSSEQAFENNNTRANLVDEASLETLDLEITAPADQNFGFLNEIEIYIKAEGLEETLLAYSYNIPENVGSTLSLETSGENLQEYIKKERYSITTKVITDKVLNRDVDIDVHMKFRIKAKLL
jgi:hypothetical protein